MKATLCSLALVFVGCGSETDKAIAEQVSGGSDTPQAEPTIVPEPGDEPETKVTQPTQVVATPVPAKTATPASTPAVVQETNSTPVVDDPVFTLHDVLGWPRSYWSPTLENDFIDGCLSTAVPTLDSYNLGYNYCICATVIYEKMSMSGEDFLNYSGFYSQQFMRIGAPEFCVQQAYEM